MRRPPHRHAGERTPLPQRVGTLVCSLMFLALTLIGALVVLPHLHPTLAAAASSTATYLGDNGRSGYNASETIINPNSAPYLKLHWSTQMQGGGPFNSVTVQPVEANGLIYWGSWNGNEYATSPTGALVWQQGLGWAYSSQCNATQGITSTATVASVPLAKQMTSVLFVGGGNATFYALNALTGSIIWQTSLGSPPNDFIWSSPAFYKGNIYIGLASFGDCPVVQGKLFQLNATTGSILHTFNVVPNGCTGGGISGSPTIDQATDTLYFATGNEGTCSNQEAMAPALVAVRTANLSLVGFWRIPRAQRLAFPDSDFITAPTLFQARIGGATEKLVGAVNKNGVYYAFRRGALSKGPLWRFQVAGTGGGCGPECGDGSVSPSAWDGNTLYVAGGQTSIGGISCKGSLRALNPSNGAIIWAACFANGPVLGAVSLVPGVAVVGEGYRIMLVSTSDGHLLYSYPDYHPGSNFYGAASISNGVLYIGNYDGILYAFGT